MSAGTAGRCISEAVAAARSATFSCTQTAPRVALPTWNADIIFSPVKTLDRSAPRTTTSRSSGTNLPSWHGPGNGFIPVDALNSHLQRLLSENVGPAYVSGYRISPDESFQTMIGRLEAKGRNSRKPTKANHGARPCSHVARRARRRKKVKAPPLPPGIEPIY